MIKDLALFVIFLFVSLGLKSQTDSSLIPSSVDSSASVKVDSFHPRPEDILRFTWGEGDETRSPMYAPLPVYNTDEEGTITVQITISPDGTISKVVPAPTTYETLRRNTINAVRHWKFSPLPPDVAQGDQVVTIDITFKLKE